jgi:hypothetical protein
LPQFEDGEWLVTNEFLCGGFAGRAFGGQTLEDAAAQLADYFDAHVGHDSIVGQCVTESGWPNMDLFEFSVKSAWSKQAETDEP